MHNQKKIEEILYSIQELILEAQNEEKLDLLQTTEIIELNKVHQSKTENLENNPDYNEQPHVNNLIKKTKVKAAHLEINQTKNISSEEKLKKDIKIFNEDVEKFRLEKEKLLTDFKVLKEQKLTNFLKKINPIIQNYMEDNSIDIVLEKKQIFIGSSDKDITNDIILLINKS